MVTRISQARFLALKRQATRRKRNTPGLSHSQALDLIAREEGVWRESAVEYWPYHETTGAHQARPPALFPGAID